MTWAQKARARAAPSQCAVGQPADPDAMVSASPGFDWLPFAIPSDAGIDRKALAGLLLEIAQDLKPELRAQQNGASASDLRLQQLRTLLLGGEIEVLSRLQS